MKAVVLAGGKGTRLAPYNTVFPKPLVPLGDRPILDIIMHQLSYYGFKDVVLSVGYLAELIEAYFRNGSPSVSDIKITFVREKEPLGTVGSLAIIPDLSESFLVMNGDILTTLDYAKLVQFHEQHGGLLTIALNRRQVKLDLGVIDINDKFEVQSFLEKPTQSYLVSMGIYVYEPEVLNYIVPGKYLDFPEVVWQMLRDGKKIVGYVSDNYWLDLGSHVDYSRAQDEFITMKDQLLPVGS
ncbi:MAG: NTP transferase domain-containing protein [Chloroflexi bacterium]|nr:NTP transferase domain-containing protein [Chloroflexota bacterium]